jgi:predicted dienelactone hydrolase
MMLNLLFQGAVLSLLWAQERTPVFYSVPPADAPELAPRGAYAVGVRTIDIVQPGQPDVLNFDKQSGKAPLYDRPLRIEIWYPASGATQQRTDYTMKLPRSKPADAPVSIPGMALRDAAPAAEGKAYPLVIVSHGYPGSRYFLSYLCENLASKGYVVAAIDHTDSVFGEEKGFQSTLLNRANDQLFTIGALTELGAKSGHFLRGVVDGEKVAIVGYSMGGYGALTSAGAGYSSKSMSHGFVPGGYFADWEAGSAKLQARLRKEVKSVVAIAPWGAQPPYRSWDADGLAAIKIPLLVIAGDQDDVSDFKGGIQPVYQNARHNVGGNPAPREALGAFAAFEAFEEPVWRKDRILSINQHFITAFLDMTLKGEESKRSFLQVSPARSSDGEWALPAGMSSGAKFSDGAKFWKGFQRRWALGLSMECLPASRE